MIFGKITGQLFTQNFAKRSFIPSSISSLVLKAFQSSFKQNPFSYTSPPFSLSRISYPQKAPNIGPIHQLSTKAILGSTLEEPFTKSALQMSDSFLIDKALEKIEQDSTCVPEVLKELPPHLHEKLAFSLLEKTPKTLYPHLLLFAFKEEKTLIDVYFTLIVAEKFSSVDRHECQMFLIENFKNFKFTDKEFIIKIALFALRRDYVSSFAVLGITDPTIIQDTLISISEKESKNFGPSGIFMDKAVTLHNESKLLF